MLLTGNIVMNRINDNNHNYPRNNNNLNNRYDNSNQRIRIGDR